MATAKFMPEADAFAQVAADDCLLVGLLGSGIANSRTPSMHEREADHFGLRFHYKLLDTDKAVRAGVGVGELLHAAMLCGFSGLNVTYPFKQAIIPHLDDLSDNADRVGAVNTVVFRDGRAHGHNTDLWGFAEGFRNEMSGARVDRVALIGTGGAGAAVSRALLQNGVQELFLVDIDRNRALDMASRLVTDFPGRRVEAASADALSGVGLDGIVNATPVGMDKMPGLPVDVGLITSDMWVADIVYFPLETELLRVARQKGCRVLSGAAMAVFQAVRAFELFTGLKPDPQRMRATFESFGNSQSQQGIPVQPSV